MSSTREWCTRERLHGLVSMQPAVSSLACVREVEANFSRLDMGPPGEAGSREVEACRGGDVVEVGVQAILLQGSTGNRRAAEEQQLLLSEARTRAAGGGEMKTGEEELLSM